MENQSDRPTTIEEYIARCPKDVQPILEKLRAAIKDAAPGAVEKISYGMPAFHQKGILVWFGAHTNHIGFYPTGEGVEAFEGDLSAYKHSKGTVQFPLDQPIPYDLVRRIVLYRVAKNLKK